MTVTEAIEQLQELEDQGYGSYFMVDERRITLLPFDDDDSIDHNTKEVVVCS